MSHSYKCNEDSNTPLKSFFKIFGCGLQITANLAEAAASASENLKNNAEGFRLEALEDLNNRFGGKEAREALSAQADELSAKLTDKYR